METLEDSKVDGTVDERVVHHAIMADSRASVLTVTSLGT